MSRIAEVLSHYNYKVDHYKTLRSRHDRGIWLITSGPQFYILKKINKATPFSLFVHYELVQKKLPLPNIHMTKNGNIFVEYKRQIYALFDYVNGMKPKKKIKNWEVLTKSLADFHIKAQKLPIPSFVPTKSKWLTFDQWMKAKENQIHFMKKQSKHILFNKKSELSKLFDEMIEQGNQSLKYCKESVYNAYVDEKQKEKQICHGDFGETSNSLMNDTHHTIIDLDEVYYGLPLGDLSHLLKKSVGKPALTENLINWYIKNEHSKTEQRMIKADLKFPYLFHYGLKNRIFRGKKTDQTVQFLKNAVEFDRRRFNVL